MNKGDEKLRKRKRYLQAPERVGCKAVWDIWRLCKAVYRHKVLLLLESVSEMLW